MKNYFRILYFIVVIFLSLFLCTSCDNKKPFVVFSTSEITQETQPIRLFKTGERIYYGLISPKGFKDNVIKIQLFKQDDKSEYWGYSYYYSREVRLNNNNYYTDYFVIHNAGHYIMQVFNISDLHSPVILGDLIVQDR